MIRLCAFSDEAGDSLSGQISALIRNGIYMTELRSVDGLTVAKLGEDDARYIQRELGKSGISVWALGSQYGKISLGDGFDRAALLRELCRLCRMAQLLGTNRIRMFSFYDSKDKSDLVFELLTESVRIAEMYGIYLFHENELDIYGDSPERVLELQKNVRGLNFVYDGANFVHRGDDAAAALDSLYPISSYFHIKDTIAATGEHVPAGEGDAGIARLIERVNAEGRDVTLTLEPHLASFEAFAAIDRTQLKIKYAFESNGEAFDAAASALRALLGKNGIQY